jgi:type-F conjugative transfer system protein TrbI
MILKNKIKKIQRQLMLVYCFLGFFLIIQLLLFMSYRAREVKPVMFNLKKTVSAFLAQAADKKLSSAEMQNLSVQFVKMMTDSVSAYAKKHHVVLILSDAVVAGADDVTSDIQSQIALAMNKKG